MSIGEAKPRHERGLEGNQYCVEEVLWLLSWLLGARVDLFDLIARILVLRTHLVLLTWLCKVILVKGLTSHWVCYPREEY